MKPDDLDFAALHREQLRCYRGAARPASAWDARAADFGRNRRRSRYAEDFIERMSLDGARTLLDVGSGPGTLALPLARRLDRVVALDYSARMLDTLRDAARAQGVANVATVHRAWEDDWHDVPVCDIAIASRSTAVEDLDAALSKLERHARLRVYLTTPAAASRLGPDLERVLELEAPKSPDPLLLLGLLQRRGVHPRVDWIETPGRWAGCADFDDLERRVTAAAGPLDARARARLRAWHDADPARALRGEPMRWAFVAWEPRQRGPASAVGAATANAASCLAADPA